MSRRDYQVRLLPVAEEDLTEIIRYIAADRPVAAESFLSKIERSLHLLSRNPRLGRVPEDRLLTSQRCQQWRPLRSPSRKHRRQEPRRQNRE